MTCGFHLKLLTAALSFCALTACSSAGKEIMGDPQNPYPLQTPPKVGDIVHLPTGIIVSLEQMLAVAGDARVVYVGETHDNPASHRLELQTLQGMEQRHPGQTALGMEMFTRSQQPALDRWVAGKLDEKSFLKESRWFDNWKMDFAYYRDLLIFARDRHIPVIALNAEKSLVHAVLSKSPEQLSPEEKSQLPEFDRTDSYHSAMTEEMFSGHGKGSQGKMHMEGFLRAQTLWDETMAESAARYLKSPQGKDRHLLVVAGGNHINYGFGIPRRVFRRWPSSYLTIGGHEIAVAEGKVPETMDVELPNFPMVPVDFLAYLTYEELPKTGVLLGVEFEPAATARGLSIKKVFPDTNAERAGLKAGDLLLSLDGEALKDSFDLVYALKLKQVGERSTLEIERQGKPLKVEILYQKSAAKEHGKP
jgi:uncharacterized iron-regulated protein